MSESELLVHKLGIRIVSHESGVLVAEMPVAGNRQPVGILHGGASAVLAETLGSLAALEHAGPRGQAVGLDLSCTHHRWVASGTVTGVCRPLHEGRGSATYEIVISDENGRRVCTARLTCAVTRRRRAAVPGTGRPRNGRTTEEANLVDHVGRR
ncbi:MAG TPA: hotdog fold thioesterase [Amycolatopsis sp.]|uniref:hotdog fold thioesterase n=1 Tax=Amycolatopsis sp. TaxID=37632 RepID=UPI002B46EA68|nr:hotdog fold thioesterase [Amycolatopsis sp.]HKS50143.1 hotdog fold thioesterase [Amycolatopsis sp.]